MIKITRLSTPESPIARLRVEGRIVFRSTGELAKACHDALTDGRPLLLDLGGVAFVDAEGAAAIAALTRRDVTVIGCTSFIAALLRSHAERDDAAAARDDDAPVLQRLRRGEPGALEDVVRRHGPRLLTVARRLLRREVEARDVVQQAFLAAWRDVATLDAASPLGLWLHRLVVATALARLRTRPPEPTTSIDDLLPRFDETGHWAGGVAALAVHPDGAARPEAHVGVRRALDRLPEPYRTVTVLHDVETIAVDEIARLLGTTAAAVRQQLHRARQALHGLLARELDADDAAGVVAGERAGEA